MALQSFTLSIGALADADNNGKNYVPNQPIYIKKTNGVLQPIYRDLAGSSEIQQDGLANVTASNGQFTFFIEAGGYNAEYQNQVTPITVVGADYFNSRVDESVQEIMERTPYVVGNFADGFTYDAYGQVGIDASGNVWAYIGAGAPNKVVTAGTVPSAPDYKQVFYNDHGLLVNRNGVGSHDDIYIRTVTLAEAQAENPPVGTRYKIEDLNNYFLYAGVDDSPNGLTEISLGGGKSLFSNQSQANFNIDPVIFSSHVYSIPKNSIVSTSTVGESVVAFSNLVSNIRNIKVSDLTISQPNDPNMSGGTANNHFCLAVFGAHDGVISDLFFDGVDLCVKTEYGAATLADRSCKRINSKGLVGVDIVGMGYQSFGSQFCNIVDMTFNGNDGLGGRAVFHGLRVTAFDFAPNIANKFSVISDNFTTGVSLQQYSNSNVIEVIANNCGVGAQIHGDAELVPEGAESHNNVINLIAKDCDVVCFSGSRGNTLNIHADGCTAGILDDNSANNWLCRDNTYKGAVLNTTGRLIEVKGYKTKVDLKLIGVGTSTTHGAIVSGDSCTGSLDIENCETPASILGSKANLSLSVLNCVNPTVISGSGNAINLNTDGDLSVTGNNNVFTGIVSGNIANTGTGNDFSGLSGTSKSGRLFSQSTNASGQLTVTHNLGFENSSSITIFGAYTVSLVSSNQNSFTLTVYNVSDGTVAASQTGLTLEYTVNARV